MTGSRRPCVSCNGRGCARCSDRGYYVAWTSGRRTREERRAARAAGVDRYGRELPRATGSSPRAARPRPDGTASTTAESARPRRTGRRQALAVACPHCGADRQQPCRRMDGTERYHCHRARHELLQLVGDQAVVSVGNIRRDPAGTDRSQHGATAPLTSSLEAGPTPAERSNRALGSREAPLESPTPTV